MLADIDVLSHFPHAQRRPDADPVDVVWPNIVVDAAIDLLRVVEDRLTRDAFLYAVIRNVDAVTRNVDLGSNLDSGFHRVVVTVVVGIAFGDLVTMNLRKT